MSVNTFRSRWLGKFALPESGWLKAMDERLSERAFCDRKAAIGLLRFLFKDLPVILQQDDHGETQAMAEAYAWTCFAFWQCGSAFPSFPENYADCLRTALRQSPEKRSVAASAIASLIVSEPGKSDGRCGFNQLSISDPALIRESERLIHAGRYEEYLHAAEKYEEYEDALGRSPEFKTDWLRIRTAFPNQTRGRKLVHRTLIPERNWERGPGARFADDAQSFQAVFDLFCWKYYLWAMEGGRPHLLKPSVVFTPLGTQIFIPGYLSFDPKRDLDFGKIARLHRARGVPRQGPGFSEGRKVTAKMKLLAKQADEEAREKGLKGDKRYSFVCQKLGLVDHGDYRQIKRLLE